MTPDGVKLQGAADLKHYLVHDRQAELVRALTENVLAYAIGRPVDYRDEATIREITDDLESNSLRARALLRHIALSSAFRQRETKTNNPAEE